MTSAEERRAGITYKKDFIVANGVRLYYEMCGVGPSVLFIAGSTGDAGNFTRTADLLADEFTVVTYDRRGNSRSERPAGWTTTSMPEQADDAAGLIEGLSRHLRHRRPRRGGHRPRNAARRLSAVLGEAVPPRAPARCRHASAGAECAMSTTIVGTLVEVRDTFLVLDGNTHITLPPGMDIKNLVVGERLMVTATSERGRWTAESIERYPV